MTAIRIPRKASKTTSKITQKSPAWYALIMVTIVLSMTGLMMVLSSSSVRALEAYGDSWLFFKKQLLWVAIGSGLLILFSRVPYTFWKKASLPLLACTLGAMFLVLIPGVGIEIAGARRWLGFGSFTIQPSEFAKFAIIVYIAHVLSNRADRMDDWKATFRPVLLVLGATVFLVMMQPDMGTTLVISGIAITMLFIAGTPMMTMLTTLGFAGCAAFILGAAEPYRRERMLAFLNPWADAGDSGYQTIQASIGLSSGQLLGVGLGASRAKWGFLPNAYTDFIFAIVGEELGFVGALCVLALFVAYGYIGVRIAQSAPDRFAQLLAAGITAWVVGQAILNIGAVVGMVPVTGVPIPYVSFGGSSLLIIMAATGVLLNIAGHSKVVRPPRRVSAAN